MTFRCDGLTKSETVTAAAIGRDIPLLTNAQEIIASFSHYPQKTLAGLEPWLNETGQA